MFRGSRLCWTQRLSPLCPAGDAIQPPADGTTDFPLFLHPPDELHPLRPAQLPVSSEDTSEAGQQCPRPFPHGRRRAAVPVPPGIWVSLRPVPEARVSSQKLLVRAGGRSGPLRRFLVTYVPWPGGAPGLCAEAVGAGRTRCGGEPGQGPVRGRSPQSGAERPLCVSSGGTPASSRWWNWTHMPFPVCLASSGLRLGGLLTALSPTHRVLSSLPGQSLQQPREFAAGPAEASPTAYRTAHTFPPTYPKHQRRGA